MSKAWEARYGKYEVKSAPTQSGCVLVLFETYVPGNSEHPQYGGYSSGTAARVFMFANDSETWAAALTELLKADPNRRDVWAFQAGSPAKPRLQLET